MLISCCVWTSTGIVRERLLSRCALSALTPLVMPGLGSDARLARCHRLDWTGAVCCSDKSTFRPGQWGADSLGCVYHSASLSLSLSLSLCLLSVAFAVSLKHTFARQPVYGFKRTALCSVSEAALVIKYRV